MSWYKYISEQQFPQISNVTYMQFRDKASQLFILLSRTRLNGLAEQSANDRKIIAERQDLYDLIDYNGYDAQLVILMNNRGDNFKKNYPFQYSKMRYQIAKMQVENASNPVRTPGVQKKRHFWFYGSWQSCQTWLRTQNSEMSIMSQQSFKGLCQVKKIIVLNKFDGWKSFEQLMLLTDGCRYQYFVVPSDCIVAVLARDRPENIFPNFYAEKFNTRFDIKELKHE